MAVTSTRGKAQSLAQSVVAPHDPPGTVRAAVVAADTKTRIRAHCVPVLRLHVNPRAA